MNLVSFSVIITMIWPHVCSNIITNHYTSFSSLLHSQILLVSLSFHPPSSLFNKTFLPPCMVFCTSHRTSEVCRSARTSMLADRQTDLATADSQKCTQVKWESSSLSRKQHHWPICPPGLYLFSGNPCLSSDQPCPLLCYWAPLTKSPALSPFLSLIVPFYLFSSCSTEPEEDSQLHPWCLLWYTPIDGTYGGHIFSKGKLYFNGPLYTFY